MLLLPDAAIQILRAGGSLKIEQGSLLPASLEQMARVAASSGGRLTIKVKLLLPDSMQQIARAGQGHVEFDLTD
jgi:hypothetical protein